MRLPQFLNPIRLSCLVWLLLIPLLADSARAEGMPSAPRGQLFQAGHALIVEVPLDTASVIQGGYPIDSAGYVDMPVVGNIYVHGKSQDELEVFLKERLSNYLKDTHIKVSPAMRITMLGYWTKQGQYYVPPNTTVWETALLAGGIGGERTLGKIKVWRGSSQTDIPFLNVYSSGLTLTAAGFRSGDIIVVPVPRDNTGSWYWFKESLTVLAQVATIASTLITLYITYELLDKQSSN